MSARRKRHDVAMPRGRCVSVVTVWVKGIRLVRCLFGDTSASASASCHGHGWNRVADRIDSTSGSY